YKNKAAFFLFDFDGRRLVRVKLEGKPLGSLGAWKLGGCSAEGRVVLYHPEQSLLLVLDPLSRPASLKTALSEAVAFLGGERARLRKQYESVGSRWLHPGPIIRH